MKQQLKKYPKMKLVSTVYGNDDPTTSTQITQGLIQQFPNLKGIISPTTVGIAAAAAVLDTPKYRGKIQLTGLGTPNQLRKFVLDGTIQGFELWNPADLGYLAGYAAVEYASKAVTNKKGQSFTAGKLGKKTTVERFAAPTSTSVSLRPARVGGLTPEALYQRDAPGVVQITATSVTTTPADPFGDTSDPPSWANRLRNRPAVDWDAISAPFMYGQL